MIYPFYIHKTAEILVMGPHIQNSTLIFLLIYSCFGYELYTDVERIKFIYMDGDKCVLYIDKKYASILTTYEHKVLTKEKFDPIFQKCFENEYRNSFLNSIFIIPGTNWCGIGTAANNLEDFGSLKEVDNCCKHHDLCPLFIRKSQCDYNLCNSWIHTISHCDCDQVFHDCLKKINSTGADLVGTLYFDLLHTNCFYENKDSPKCPLLKKDANGKCNTALKRLKYVTHNYLANLPFIRRIKQKFFTYLNWLMLKKES